MRTDYITQPIRVYKSIGAQYDLIKDPVRYAPITKETTSSSSEITTKRTPLTTPPVSFTSDTEAPPVINQSDESGWYISNLGITTNGQASFDMTFNISKKEYEVSVLNVNCITDVAGAFSRTENVHSSGANFEIVTTSFAINQTNIERNEIWNSDNGIGRIEFCVKMATYYDTDHETLMNSLDTVYRIDVDRTAGFEIGNIDIVRSESTDIDSIRKVARDGRGYDMKHNAEMAQVVAFQCNDSYNELKPAPALRKGDVLQICVKVDDISSLFEIDYVETLNITQSITQSYNDNSPLQVILNGNPYAYQDLTDITCNDGENKICKVEFQLLDSSFELESLPDLGVFGNVKLTVKDDSRLEKSTDILGNGVNSIGTNHYNIDRMFGLMVNLSAESSACAKRENFIPYAISIASCLIYVLL